MGMIPGFPGSAGRKILPEINNNLCLSLSGIIAKNLQEHCFPQDILLEGWCSWIVWATHSLIRGVLIQSCPAGAKNFTNYVFCHPQFSGVIQNIENCCAIRAKFKK